MGWGNIYKRRLKVFSMAFLVYLDYKALQQREKWLSKVKKDALWEEAHQRNAKRILHLITELEGLWVKMGQYMSTRADVLPQAYIFFLRQLQDSLPPRALEEICHTIEKELGQGMEDLFLKFDETPLATASIAQVHRATLHDGKEVVVKVQHEGIKSIILEDLKNLKAIVDWIAWAEPQYNFSPIIDEWCKEAPKELDFNHEAENTRKVSRNLGCKNRQSDDVRVNSVDVLIPEVIQSTEKLLLLEYMDGVRLNDFDSLDALGVDKQKLIEEITRAYAHQIYVDGFFNGDPHPGNFLVSKDPPHRPILLDFGLTKLISVTMKQALAKMLLAAGEGDHVALLSAFAEMGFKLRLDMPEQAMEVTGVFFRTSTPAAEAQENMKSLTERDKRLKKSLQEKLKLDQKETKRFNPIDAFPGDIVIFSRVLNLLRGISSSMNIRIAYLEIMRPFAESVLQNNIAKGPALNPQWICNTKVHSDVEVKLRQLLIEFGNTDKVLGIQVCAYKDGEVIIDTAAGVLGRYDPRPVQPDSLFPSFSTTKGITAGMVHWLVDNGKLKLEENVANIWPEFRSNGKDIIKVHHVLNHTSGLHNALAGAIQTNPLLMLDWDECLKEIAASVPETEPGREQLYHYMSFGWLCGGIIEHATGKKFQEILEEAFVRPLNVEGEMYIGIPPGVESRLATLTVDTEDLKKLSGITNRPDLPSTFQPHAIAEIATSLSVQFNTLGVRRAIIPAANGHFSARALARYYATLADHGKVPPPHSSFSKPPLGSHTHIPKFPSLTPEKKQKKRSKKKSSSESHDVNGYISVPIEDTGASSSTGKRTDSNIFINPKIHDAFLGRGEYENFVLAGGKFGLGFKKWEGKDGTLVGFGHSGMGGSTGYCDIENRFSISVTLNKMSFGGVTGKIVEFVCSELGIPVPDEFSSLQSSVGRPMIN